MKMILLSDVKALGKKGDVVEVADGYGQNFLIPKRLAAPATEGAVKKRHKEMADRSSKHTRELEATRALAQELEAKPLVVRMKVGQGGKLFGSVTSTDIAKAIKDQFGKDLDKRSLEVPSSLKSVGEHVVKAKLLHGVQAKVAVVVEPEAQ